MPTPTPLTPLQQTQLTRAQNQHKQQTRRTLLTATLTLLATTLPPLTGLGILLHPLRRKNKQPKTIHITTTDTLPPDGTPRKYTILADQTDAWNHTPQTPIGTIYLRRTPHNQIQALHTNCPHAGCHIHYQPTQKNFHCPCHNSQFNLDGTIQNPNSPSPRPLDTLPTQIKNNNQIWVQYQNYQPGTPKKIPTP